jgi:hypothetical protein
MSQKSSSDDVGDSNETTEATLAALTMQINEFVGGRTFDSRCAAKLVKRLKKEGDAVAESGKATKTGQKELERLSALSMQHCAITLRGCWSRPTQRCGRRTRWPVPGGAVTLERLRSRSPAHVCSRSGKTRMLSASRHGPYCL